MTAERRNSDVEKREPHSSADHMMFAYKARRSRSRIMKKEDKPEKGGRWIERESSAFLSGFDGICDKEGL